MMSEWEEEDEANKPVYINWFISMWCNYKCSYCFYKEHPKNANWVAFSTKMFLRRPQLLVEYFRLLNRNSSHAFNNYPPIAWCEAFAAFAPRKLAVAIGGGEPFLDKRNFRELLARLTSMNHIAYIRCDTNGSWNPGDFRGVDWQKVELNIAYHPEMISVKSFVDSITKKIHLGLNITMVNYVLAPNQIEIFQIIRQEMDNLGIFTNANVCLGHIPQIQTGEKIYNALVPQVDVALKTGKLITKDQMCSYPRYAYQVDPTGMLTVGCFPELRGHFVKKRFPRRFAGPVPCPSKNCVCIDRYAFLRLTNRAKKLDLLKEYVEECKSHRRH